MQRHFAYIIAALALPALGGCMTMDDKVASTEAENGQTSITGSLTYRERIALPPNAVMRVTLNDISLADAPSTVLAEQIMQLDGQQVPLPFSLSVDSEKLQPRRRYAVRGIIEGTDGSLMWTTDTAHMVEADDAMQNLGALQLKQVQRKSAMVDETLSGGEWVVEDINNRGIIDNSRVTLNFSADGTLSGRASCNNYSGTYESGGNVLTIPRPFALTRKACPPALMNQETDFMAIVEGLSSYSFDQTGALVLTDDKSRTILARR